MDKKALSPVVATVLLIALVLILAAIVFLWARAFLPETIQKFDSPIADACENVVFDAYYDADTKTVTILNNGNVPIYTIQVGKRSMFGLEYLSDEFAQRTIVTGASADFPVSSTINSGDELIVVPVLLGRDSSNELRGYACGDDSGEIIQVP